MISFRAYIAFSLLFSLPSSLFCPYPKREKTRRSLDDITTAAQVSETTSAESPTVSVYSKHSIVSPEERIRAAISPKYRTANDLSEAETIFISIFCFTSNEIYKNVVQAADKGTKVTVIADWNQAHHGYSKIPLLARHENISVYVVTKKTLHTKVMCVEYTDGTTCVLEGSYNYTASAKKHEETLDVHLSPSHYESRKEELNKLITEGTATPFNEEALIASKMARAHQKAMKTKSADDDDDDEDDITDSSTGAASSSALTTPASTAKDFLSPPRKPHEPVKPSPCSLDPGTRIDTSPVALARAATLLAQMQLEPTLIALIAEAKMLRILMYNISSKAIADALIDAHTRGADIEIIADHLQSCGQSSQINRLRDAGLTISRNKSDMLHCKCFIIETLSGEQLVIGGSGNLSSRVFAGLNIEQSTRLTGEEVFAFYMKLYESIKAKSKPLAAPIVPKTPRTRGSRARADSIPTLPLSDITNKQTRKVSKHSSVTTEPNFSAKPSRRSLKRTRC